MEIAPREIGVNWQQTNGRTDVQRTDGRPHGRPAHITPVTAYCWRQKSIIKFTYIAPSIAHSVQHVYNQTTLKFQMLTESYNTYLPAINCRQPVLFQLHQYGRNMDYLFLHVVTIVFSCFFCKSLEWVTLKRSNGIQPLPPYPFEAFHRRFLLPLFCNFYCLYPSQGGFKLPIRQSDAYGLYS